MQATLSLRQRATIWQRAVQGPAGFARQAAWLGWMLGLGVVARFGTPLARAGALVGCLGAIVVAIGLWVARSRRASDARQLVRTVITPTDAGVGARAMRAATLVERLAAESGPEASQQLARFHLDKVVSSASLERVQRAASRRARMYRVVGVTLAAGIGVLGALGFRELLEGFDVLLAQDARAPVPMLWTERLKITAQPPAYLRVPSRRLLTGATSLLPKGTSLTLRARPLYEGRTLVVSDGTHEIPFVSDGEGGVVAHYDVDDDAQLVVAARFGEVLITEPELLHLVALEDEAPVVVLEDAPKTFKLSELERLELRWKAADDHGLTQIDLVLRSGTREERRTLGSYDDETSHLSGGHVLLPTDPFLRSLYLPATVSIEAKDNDPVGGSKWGRSQAFEIVPTAVGEPDAARYLALTRARDRFVDALALLEVPELGRGDDARYATRMGDAVSGFEEAVNKSYGSLRVPAGLRSFALGRLRVLAARKGPPMGQASSLGDMILAVDGALASLSTRDAVRVAKLLADVAEEAMVGAAQARAVEGGQMGVERLDRALFALRAGAEQLTLLGTLGNDLGSVAVADMGRVQRARDARDFFHAELAARHLADRLRRPTPSFGASGGQSGGVEAGGGSGSGEPSPGGGGGGEPSEAERAFDQLARQISELTRDHASAVENVDQALSDARSGAGDESLRDDAERRAQGLREAVDGLPEPGRSPGSAEAAAALGREHARAMAYNLESLRLGDAVESGRRAVAALQEATNKPADDPRLAQQSEVARLAVEEQLAWVESQLEAARSAARERARSALSGPAALEEELAGNAANLARRGENEKTPLPSDATELLRQADQLMRQAARELSNGDGESGLELQRQAQRLLETIDHGKTSDDGTGEDGERKGKPDGDDGRQPGFGGEVPEAAEQNKAEEFRRRVLESLGDGSGRFAPAIKRYAEGLLR
ncbi:MAG TPA: DUF4175 domain-containing protein [Polyangiaceae bacterium]|nr:DUF4175 domain-containing protein [Polyangiaceae bacterium]